MEKYTVGNTETPWQTVSLKGNFGHNSGSCQARYLSLPKLANKDFSVFVFENGSMTAKKKEFV